MRLGVGVILLGSAGVIFGQQQLWQPEIRRALPVEKPSPTPVQAPRAIPVQTPGDSGADPESDSGGTPCLHPSFDAPACLSESGLDGTCPAFTDPHGHSAPGGDTVSTAGPNLGCSQPAAVVGRGDSSSPAFAGARKRRYPAESFHGDRRGRGGGRAEPREYHVFAENVRLRHSGVRKVPHYLSDGQRARRRIVPAGGVPSNAGQRGSRPGRL